MAKTPKVARSSKKSAKKPAKAAKPTQVAKLAKPAKVAKAAKPTQVAKLAKPAKVAKAAKSAQPTKKATRATNPTKPTKPTKLTKPTKSTKPTKPATVKKARKATAVAVFVDDRGEQVLGPYDDATSFADGYAGVRVGDRWGVIDKRGTFVVEARFASLREPGSGFVAVRDDSGKAGYFDIANSRWLVEPRFDYALGFVGDHACVVMGGEIPDWAAAFQTWPDGGAWGVVDRRGEIVIPIDRGQVRVHDGVAYVNQGGRASAWGHPQGGANYYVDLATGTRIGGNYKYASLFGEGLACVQGSRTDDWRIIDRTGTEVGRIDPNLTKYAPPEPFSQGHAVLSCTGKTSHRSKYVLVTTSGAIAADDLGDAHSFCDGMAAVNRGGEKVQGECRKGTWGFLALDGTFVTRKGWGQAWAFSEGRGKVSGPGGFLVVDRSGETVFTSKTWIAPYSNGLALLRKPA